jgi:hypothetical protein
LMAEKPTFGRYRSTRQVTKSATRGRVCSMMRAI